MMIRNDLRMLLMGLWVVVAALPGCGKAKPDAASTAVVVPSDHKSATVKNGPKWIDKNGEGLGKPGDLFAAGMCDARRVTDRGLQRTAAQEDARARLALTLQSRVSALNKNFNRALSNLNEKPISESDISQVSRSFADTTLHGVRFVETWRDPETGDIHVLATLPFDDGLAQQLKQQIMANGLKGASAQAHEELDKAIQDVQKNGWPK